MPEKLASVPYFHFFFNEVASMYFFLVLSFDY